MKVPELLAPAGGKEQLEYAIRFGADAVYLACERFGMRQRADNFALKDLPALVSYAHERGVKVHVTCNIIMHDEDLEALVPYLEALDAAGVDALIIGDLGAFALASKYAPHVDLHVSTQASVSNAQAARVWYELGARRIVCARELSLEQIRALREEIPKDLELECFVHGSMCMAYSGRCLISDFMAGRSALSGHCAQSCRWHYTLEEEKRPGEHYPISEDANGTYIMNAKDLNMLSHLGELAAAGVDSVKIEGRNKKAFYVASVVNAYRQVLDGADPERLQPELDAVSHRPYSTGFYYGYPGQDLASDGRQQRVEWAAESLIACRSRVGVSSRTCARETPFAPTTPSKCSRLEHPSGSCTSTGCVSARNLLKMARSPQSLGLKRRARTGPWSAISSKAPSSCILMTSSESGLTEKAGWQGAARWRART